MSTLILDKRAVASILTMPSTIEAVEKAFLAQAAGVVTMPGKSYICLGKGDFRAMPAALPGGAGVKWVNVHPQNYKHCLPTVMAIIIYSDPKTGYPLAIMDATDITAYRTGAAAAVASKHLARPDSHILGLVGAGRQSYAQINAHAELFDIHTIRVCDVLPAAVARIVRAFPQFEVICSSLEEVATSDIVCTLTPGRAPILKDSMVGAGTHINAVGADAEGKEELEPSILKRATVVVDDLKQAAASGEINVPIAQGLYSPSEVYATLAEIIAGKKEGRTDPKAVTVFDATGVAIEDVAVAKLVYDQAKKDSHMSVQLVD